MSDFHAITWLAHRRALFAVNHSGGKDSQAMLIRLLKIIPREQLVVVHATLGENEWPGALELAEQHADREGLPFIVARPVKTFFQMVEHRYAVRPGPNSPCWPSKARRQCTSDLKRGPIARETRRFSVRQGFDCIVTCMGIRAQESPDRAKAVPFRRNERGSIKARDWFDWLPIHDMTETEVFSTIAGAGQLPHYAYALGNERLSCVFCILASRNDLRSGAKHHPALLAKYQEIERRTGYTMHQSRKSLAELVSP